MCCCVGLRGSLQLGLADRAACAVIVVVGVAWVLDLLGSASPSTLPFILKVLPPIMDLKLPDRGLVQSSLLFGEVM